MGICNLTQEQGAPQKLLGEQKNMVEPCVLNEHKIETNTAAHEVEVRPVEKNTMTKQTESCDQASDDERLPYASARENDS